MPPDLTLRPARADDLPAMLGLFRETVQRVNSADYTPAQVAAWAPADADPVRWLPLLAEAEVRVALRAGELVGFCAWTRAGYLDLLYVHHAHQRRGIASRLYAAAEADLRARGVARVHTAASVTAQPFFLRQGFSLVRAQEVEVRGVRMPNAVMEKLLG